MATTQPLFSRDKLSVFKIIYHSGLGIFAFVLWMLYRNGNFATPTTVQNYSMLHMIACTAIALILKYGGLKKTASEMIYLGNRVALLGYLHTLIGISAALLFAISGAGKLAGDPKAFMESLLAPTSSALLTSFLGWWIGAVIKQLPLNEPTVKSSNVAFDAFPAFEARSALTTEILKSATEHQGIVRGMNDSLHEARIEAEQTTTLMRELNESLRNAAQILNNSCSELAKAIQLLDEAYRNLGMKDKE